MENEFFAVTIFAVATNVLALFMRAKNRQNQPTNISYVGHVEKLFLYPVKSCPAIEVDSAVCRATGLQISNLIKDRHFQVVAEGKNGEPCIVMTQRQYPRMALIRITRTGGDEDKSSSLLRFSAPDMPDLDIELPIKHQPASGTETVLTARIWGVTTYGRDCGPNAAAWFRIFLGRDDLFLMHSESEEHLKALGDSPNLAASVVDRLRPTDKTAYADWAPLLLINSTSIDDVNVRISASLDDATPKPITCLNFRPNLLFRAHVAYDEDNFDSIYIGSPALFDADLVSKMAKMQEAGTKLSKGETQSVINSSSVILRNVKPCTRCVLTTVEPTLGEKRPDGQPLKMLRMFRLHKDYGNSPLFGINCVPDKTGPINVGDVVFVSYIKN